MLKFILTFSVLLGAYSLRAQSEFKFCGEPYTSRYFMVPDELKKLHPLDVVPRYKGSKDSLEAYFSDKEIEDKFVEDMIWKVSVLFKVNCKGEAGDFELLTEGDERLKNAGDQVVSAVKNMPQKWQPALKDGKPVDCFHVLEFTMIGRSLKKVGYREVEKD